MKESRLSMQEKRTRGSGRKRAPEGFYTAQQAQKRLGLAKTSFYYYVNNGKIKPVVPPLRKEGYYSKEEIDQLADEMTLLFLQHAKEQQLPPTEFRIATEEDAQGIVDVLTSLGWSASPVSLRRSWYRVNPLIDYVVLQNNLVMGYLNIVPYVPEALENLMSGKWGGRDIRPQHILSFTPGEHDVFIGIVTRDVPYRERYGRRLLSGIRQVMEAWARQGIIIHRMHAVSAEPDGIALCEALGFNLQPRKEGDRPNFNRFVLDLTTSAHPFAQRYREAIQKARKE